MGSLLQCPFRPAVAERPRSRPRPLISRSSRSRSSRPSRSTENRLLRRHSHPLRHHTEEHEGDALRQRLLLIVMGDMKSTENLQLVALVTTVATGPERWQFRCICWPAISSFRVSLPSTACGRWNVSADHPSASGGLWASPDLALPTFCAPQL